MITRVCPIKDIVCRKPECNTVPTGCVMTATQPDYEERYHDAPVLDEVVIRNPTFVHFELMGDDHLWCGIDCADGSHIRIDIHSGDRGQIVYHAEREHSCGSDGTTPTPSQED